MQEMLLTTLCKKIKGYDDIDQLWCIKGEKGLELP